MIIVIDSKQPILREMVEKMNNPDILILTSFEKPIYNESIWDDDFDIPVLEAQEPIKKTNPFAPIPPWDRRYKK